MTECTMYTDSQALQACTKGTGILRGIFWKTGGIHDYCRNSRRWIQECGVQGEAAGLREPEFIGGEVDLRINIYRGQVDGIDLSQYSVDGSRTAGKLPENCRKANKKNWFVNLWLKMALSPLCFSKHCLYKELKGAGGGIGLRPSIRHFALQLTTIVCIIEAKIRILLSWL